MTYRHDPDQPNASVEELYAEVLSDNEIDDVLITFDDGDGTEFSVEFVDFDDPPFRGFNVAGPLPDDVHGLDVANAVDLDATDAKDDFVVLESDAETGREAADELAEIADAIGVFIVDMESATRRQIETGFGNQLAKKLMQMLGIGRPDRSA